MKKTTYQIPELRDENDNIIQEGTFGKKSAFVNSTNDGAFDYLLNNLEALHDIATGAYILFDSKDKFPAVGDTSKIYVSNTDGKAYRWNGTEYIYMGTDGGFRSTDGGSIDLSAYAKKTDLSAYEKADDASAAHKTLQSSIDSLSSGKQDKLIFDTTPTADSTNPVTSGGIKAWVESKGYLTTHQDLSGYAKKTDLSAYQTKLTFDTTPTADSTNPVTSGGVKSYVDSKVLSGGSGGTVDLSGYQTKLTFDTSPTAGSTNPVTSGGIKTWVEAKGYLTTHQDISGKQDKLTFDTTPTANSTNPVTSGGIKSYVDAAIAAITDADSTSY